jgi:hypothetical protein
MLGDREHEHSGRGEEKYYGSEEKATLSDMPLVEIGRGARERQIGCERHVFLRYCAAKLPVGPSCLCSVAQGLGDV